MDSNDHDLRQDDDKNKGDGEVYKTEDEHKWKCDVCNHYNPANKNTCIKCDDNEKNKGELCAYL